MCPQMYFNSTLTDSSKLLKPMLVFSFIICAIICGLTRIIQYKNHATDVYLGFLLGSSIAVYLVGTSTIQGLFLFLCHLWRGVAVHHFNVMRYRFYRRGKKENL